MLIAIPIADDARTWAKNSLRENETLCAANRSAPRARLVVFAKESCVPLQVVGTVRAARDPGLEEFF